MELKTKWKKIISIFLFITILSSSFLGNINTVYGRINESYSQGETSGNIDVDQASSDSPVLDAIGHFVYAIAGFIESAIGKIIGSFTGDDIFPWADRIIFNTIPFLDVNFLSPSNGSMFRNNSGTDTMFGNIIGNIYYTIFTLAVAFFGVVVGIMAMRLAISSIASEKAKYKQAITNWLLALILLFTTHYLMSFIFFINEKMVEVASSVFKTQLEENQNEINLDFSVEYDQAVLDKLFDRFFKLYYWANGNDEDTYILYDVYVPVSVNDNGVKKVSNDSNIIKLATNGTKGKKVDESSFEYMFYTTTASNVGYDNDGNKYSFDGNGGWDWSDTQKGAVKNSILPKNSAFEQKFKVYLHALMSNNNYITNYREEISDAVSSTTGLFHEFDVGEFSALRDMRRIVNDALFLTNIDSSVSNVYKGEDYVDSAIEKYQENVHQIEEGFGYSANTNYKESIRNIFKKVHSTVDKDSNSTYAQEEIISNLADFFKETIYISSIDLDYDADEEEELVNIEFQPIVAILYTIFVIQSIMYFIAYIKRFFYIVVLALFAPLVIIYDFLMKTALG